MNERTKPVFPTPLDGALYTLLQRYRQVAIDAAERGMDELAERLGRTAETARNWVIRCQLARRNISPEQASYLRGLRYNAEKGERGKNYQSDNSTHKMLAKEYGVGQATIVRDGKFAEAVDKLRENCRLEIEPGNSSKESRQRQQKMGT